MRNKSKTSGKDGIIFILTIVLLYTWFEFIPSIRRDCKDACRSYVEEKDIDNSITMNDYFEVDSSDTSEMDDGWIR